MISFVKGLIYSKDEEKVIIENNGIGYNIYVSPNNLNVGDNVLLHTYQHVREDEISLFGFLDTFDREVFLHLITVKGIGPKTANNILAKSNAKDIATAVANSDVNYLKTLPGIGPKSAQQIILDLQKKLVASDEPIASNNDLEDALSGLASLGLSTNDIKYVKEQLRLKVMSTDEYLKAGLQLINKRKGG